MADEQNPSTGADDGTQGLMHAAVLSNISLFDQKSAMLLTYGCAGAVFCVWSVAGFTAVGGQPVQVQTWADWFLLLTAFLFARSAVLTAWVVWPRTGLSSGDPLYWGAWPDARGKPDFVHPVEKLSSQALHRARWRHIGLLGDICRLKMGRFRSAFAAAMVAFVCLLAIEACRFIPGPQAFLVRHAGLDLQWLVTQSTNFLHWL